MGTRRQQLGDSSERLALELLHAEGYHIEHTNVRFPVGELDVVAREGQTLCFVEVRSTSSQEWGGPLATITARKRTRLIQAARWYLKRLQELPHEIRFDVVAISYADSGNPSVELIRGAFEAERSW